MNKFIFKSTNELVEAYKVGEGTPPQWWVDYYCDGNIQEYLSNEREGVLFAIYSMYGGIIHAEAGNWLIRFPNKREEKYLNILVVSDDTFKREFVPVLDEKELIGR